MRILGSLMKRQAKSRRKRGHRWISDDDDFFRDSKYHQKVFCLILLQLCSIKIRDCVSTCSTVYLTCSTVYLTCRRLHISNCTFSSKTEYLKVTVQQFALRFKFNYSFLKVFYFKIRYMAWNSTSHTITNITTSIDKYISSKDRVFESICSAICFEKYKLN